MSLDLIKKIVGSSNDRVLRSLKPTVGRINDLAPRYEKLSDEELRNQTQEFRSRFKEGESLDAMLPEAFAVVREAGQRVLSMRHFDVQLIGGIVLHQGKIAEMRTGEGKTLVATLAAYLNAIPQKGVHIVTVNDYLAKRDSEWMGQIYKFLGLEVGVVYSGMDDAEKKAAYLADITYGQNNEFGFDYLRSNMRYSLEDVTQTHHHFAIVDEVDSILIDEARTPLIISGPAEDSSENYYKANQIIPKLKQGEHYEVDLRSKSPSLNEDGIKAAEELLQVENLYEPQNIELLHCVNQSLKAHATMERDVDYVVNNGKIVIVDEFTGRLMPGRRWSDGLHQAIEAKENLKIARENQTLASITFQNLFRLYDKLSGMTGTAATEALEFKEIYKLDVVVIPTNRPLARDDQSDVVYRTRKEKYSAACDDIKEIHETGQPILVGTISIEQSEDLSRTLKARGIEHQVLNAKHHEREANIVAQAGRLGAVTIATNMAGRGTDIVLGGNPEGLAIDEYGHKDYDSEEFKMLVSKYQEECRTAKKKVLEAGGLFIMGTERHESRRIDNQLRGRAGRQGDPGISRFYISLEDDLMKRFGGDRIQQIMNRLGWEEGAAIDGRMISRSIESAQTKVERMHFESRKHVTEYDDVMNKQRQVIYNLRNRILRREDLREEVVSMIDDLLEDLVLSVCDERQKPVNWNLEAISERYKFLFNANLELDNDIRLDQQVIFDHLREAAHAFYEKHSSDQQNVLSSLQTQYVSGTDLQISISSASDNFFDFQYETYEQESLLEALDHFWNMHLQSMDQLRDGIGLRGYGQKNPLHEYQKEGFELFSRMLTQLKESVVRKLCYSDARELEEMLAQFEVERQRRAEIEAQMQASHESVLGEDEEDSDKKAAPKDPSSERAKLEAQRKARRKNKKR